jgi:hypothetical protein
MCVGLHAPAVSVARMPPGVMAPSRWPRVRADPVVASDGNTYERSAILTVLQSVNPVSPLTRETLKPDVFSNRALKKRIDEHEEEVLRIAATVYATGIAAVSGEPSGGASGASSSDAPPAQRRSGRAGKRAAAPPSEAGPDASKRRRRR